MEPIERIEPREWMAWPETRAVVAALTADGAPARFVGGCVRDSVLGRAVKDVDIATPVPPDRVMSLLRDKGIDVVPTGLKHGTVTAVKNPRHFEVTTLRRDVETYGRHASVAFTDDWVADAWRRDFTMNALYLDPDGALYDPTGGLADLRDGRVRFVGEASARIREDYLRILRFFRFHAHYGAGPLDRDGFAACRHHASGLALLSGERVSGELFRLLAAADPAPVILEMATAGIWQHVVPAGADVMRLANLVRLAPDSEPIVRLAALVEGGTADLDALADSLRLSNAERRRLHQALEGSFDLDQLDEKLARQLIYRRGKEAFVDRLLIAWAERPKADARPWLTLARQWRVPAFPLRGRDLKTLGIAAGPHLGGLLTAVEDWWVAGDFTADKAGCLAYLKKIR